ncbi:MAG: hypothetical protein GY803_15825 [Chloroflexi bacterium]|nr:hypothetical protein [Chloroflexota bacterium]
MDQTSFTEITGVRIVLVAMTAGRGMIDIRYQIVDPDKAIVVHDYDNPPALIVEKNDALLNRTRHEGSHDFELHPGVVYSVQIMNSGGLISSGSVVSVQIGDGRLEHVTVQ